MWTDLSATAIAEALSELRDDTISAYTAKQLLEQEGYGQRQAQKNQTMGEHPDRDAQFQSIAEREFLWCRVLAQKVCPDLWLTASGTGSRHQ